MASRVVDGGLDMMGFWVFMLGFLGLVGATVFIVALANGWSPAEAWTERKIRRLKAREKLRKYQAEVELAQIERAQRRRLMLEAETLAELDNVIEMGRR